MTPAPGVRSFDGPRERKAPEIIEGCWLNGAPASVQLTDLTLIVAVKTSCDGCRLFVESQLDELAQFQIIVVSATADENGEWVNARQSIMVAPGVLEELEIRWPPFYVLIDPRTRRVLTEGVVFAPEQVADEIQRYLRP